METTSPDHLPLTGERTVPDVPDESYWFARHVVAYELAGDHVDGATVLDAGCGEGYGLAMLRTAGASRVLGADLDATTVAHARRRYATADPRIAVVRCELMALPLPDDAVDVTCSFQVIEHVHDVAGYLASLGRVTRPGGTILLATPNRLTFTPDSDVPVNPFHHVEFTAGELVSTVAAAGLEVRSLLGVHHGPRIRTAERTHGPLVDVLTAAPPDAWDDDVRALVHGTTAADFELRRDDLDGSLDLVATCVVPDPLVDRPGPAAAPGVR